MILRQMQMSGNCYKVRLAARQLGNPSRWKTIPCTEERRASLRSWPRIERSRALLELDDGRCRTESGAILWYLTNGTDLQPSDDWGQAQALQWMFFEQYSHEPYVAVARCLTRRRKPWSRSAP